MLDGKAMAMTTPGAGVAPWFHKKVVDPLIQILRRGAEPKLLAFSSALGTALGVFPICGVPVFLCGMAIAILRSRCHAPSVMLFNFMSTPIELGLVIPFLRLGETISGGPHFPLTSDALRKVLAGNASREVLMSILHALVGWAVAAPVIFGVLYLIFLPIFKLLIRKFSTNTSSRENTILPPGDVKIKVRDM